MQIPLFYSHYFNRVFVAAGGQEETAAKDVARYGTQKDSDIWFLVNIAPLED